MVVRKLKHLAKQLLGPGISLGSRTANTQPALTSTLGDQALEDVGFLFGRDKLAGENAGSADPAAQPGSPSWEATARGRGEATATPEPAAPAPAQAPKPRRNLLFSSYRGRNANARRRG